METTNDARSENPKDPGAPGTPVVTTAATPNQSTVRAPVALAQQVTHSDKPLAAAPAPPTARTLSRSRRKWLLLAALAAGTVAGGYVLYPLVLTAL
ncbi:MAG: hypothetical protein ACM3U2_14900, partial [Deltaproteobacteria bacterium]